ncbi:MAG: cytochrome P450 [Mycobacterium sp.]|nr:cytochrome P450 [Mycobacterium sp.]
MALSTLDYVRDQARRRLTPTLNTVPGMGVIDRRLRARDWPQYVYAEPPPDSDLKPVMGDSGLPVLGHLIELFRGGPEYVLQMYRKYGPLHYSVMPGLNAVGALGPDAAQAVFVTRAKDFSQRAWEPVIGPFFHRGLMMLDFDEHRYHRRIMQEAFTRDRLAGYVGHIDRVAAAVVARDWPADDPRFLFHPAVKELTLDIASLVFMGHDPGTDRDQVSRVNRAFSTATRAGGAIVRTSVPPFKWWRGLKARAVLEEYFAARVAERRASRDADMLTVLCHTADDDGNRFTDDDIVNHMIFLMMAAHDTSTSTLTTMAYHLAANPRWQDRCRDESARLGSGPLDLDALEKLQSLDLVINECLRLVTPLPFTVRQAVRDTEILGYYIPAGTNVTLWPGMTHRMNELWTDPERFDPDRFAEPRCEHKRHRYAFTPFGGGAHKCIGMVFGQLEIKTVMHRLLGSYRLELPYPGYRPRYDHAGMPMPIDGMPITLRPL